MTLPLLGSYQQPHFSDPTLPYRVKRVVNVKKIHAMTLFYKYLGRTPIGNSTVIVGILINFSEKTKKELNIKGNLLQAVGGGVSLADALGREPTVKELYSIYGNLLQAIGNALQALSGINELRNREGQELNVVGSWIQAIGSIISALGQSK